MFHWNGTTKQIEQSSHGKSLARKEVRRAMKIESRRGTVGVRKAIRQGSAEEEVRKHRDRLLLCFINPRVGKKRGLQLPWDLLQNSPLLLCR